MFKICLITLGCPKNEVDSSLMEELIRSAGFAVNDDPLDSDAIIVNTCCFIQEATEESLEVIFALHDAITEKNVPIPLIVAGCMPARYRETLTKELTEGTAFVPCSEESRIVEVLHSVLPHPNQLCGSRSSSKGFPARSLVNSGVSRYVKISDGCDRFCSYCAIPLIRGSYHSFPLSDILKRVEYEIDSGALEIVFIAQDTGRWGRDLQPSLDLSDLLDSVAAKHPHIWFRILYTEPDGITDRLIDVVAAHENICNYFDIPFQHVNARILRNMNRSGSFESYSALVSRIRTQIPDVTLRTTFISGFPGESDEDFSEVLDFIESAQLDYVGVFPFSAEEGTVAADMPHQIDETTKLSRAQEIRDLADSISFDRISSRKGTEADLIIEGIEEDGQLFGRLQCQAPEIDGVTYIDKGAIGEKVRVAITDVLFYEMEGSVVEYVSQ